MRRVIWLAVILATAGAAPRRRAAPSLRVIPSARAIRRGNDTLERVTSMDTGRRTSRCMFDKGFSLGEPLPSNETRTTPGDNLYLGWGAGTYVSEAALCLGHGGWGDAGDGAADDLSPNRRYQLVYVPAGAPLADPPGFRIYDLATGKALPQSAVMKRGCRATQVTWRARALALTCEAAKGDKPRRIVVHLPHRALPHPPAARQGVSSRALRSAPARAEQVNAHRGSAAWHQDIRARML